jgi:hypothetical protein
MKNLELLKESIIKFLSKGNLDEPYIFSGKKSYTKKMIIEEIQNNTIIGNEFINNLILLSLDLLDRKKENIKNFKKV